MDRVAHKNAQKPTTQISAQSPNLRVRIMMGIGKGTITLMLGKVIDRRDCVFETVASV